MTNANFDTKIADAMAALHTDDIVGAIKKAWKNYSEDLKKEARAHKRKGEKLAEAVDRLSDSHPCELYCYIMFDEEGDPRGWTIDHQQYWQGNSGPTSAISLSPNPTYEEIEREIGNDLAEALEIED
jgi:hypothetical protein